MNGSHQLIDSVNLVPAGAWAVGVSGGADSVALLRLLATRADLHLRVVHLDHQTRAGASAADAAFVAELAARLGLACTVATRVDVEATLAELPRNPSGRFRAARLALFRQTVASRDLRGVLLAHHADDVAETVLQRLLRGSGPAGLTGIAPRSVVRGLLVMRPLVRVTRAALRAYLADLGQAWREDASNASGAYLRNRLRPVLRNAPALTQSLLELAGSCAALRDWAHDAAPTLPPQFRVEQLCGLTPILSRESARRWLAARGAPEAALSPDVLDRLTAMAADAATPARQHFPGRLLVGRKGGLVSAAGTPM
jgi:tRNA(Ile)-lysidine synthase